MDSFMEKGDVLIYFDSEGEKAVGIIVGFGERQSAIVGNGSDRFNVPPYNVIEVIRRTVDSSIAAEEMTKVVKVRQLVLF